ncbi:MAG: YggU family protein [Verrucomicrobia bacterium]|nr:YggU family protein [Verrucomicrobiota bacterium]
MLEWINETSDGVTVKIRAVPRASKNEIQGFYDDALKIRLTSAPVDGKANQALIKFLSKSLNISKAQIRIEQGETSRHKTVHIGGLTKTAFMERLSL